MQLVLSSNTSAERLYSFNDLYTEANEWKIAYVEPKM